MLGSMLLRFSMFLIIYEHIFYIFFVAPEQIWDNKRAVYIP